jgi:hypothetical protein
MHRSSYTQTTAFTSITSHYERCIYQSVSAPTDYSLRWWRRRAFAPMSLINLLYMHHSFASNHVSPSGPDTCFVSDLLSNIIHMFLQTNENSALRLTTTHSLYSLSPVYLLLPTSISDQIDQSTCSDAVSVIHTRFRSRFVYFVPS